MEYNDKDFEKLRYKVHELKEKESVLEVYPELSRYPEFKKKIRLDINKVLKYIIYLYDKKSPFISEPDLRKRKIISAQKAGFKVNSKGEFENEVVAMLSNENVDITRMIVRYCRIQSSMTYSLLVAGMETYYDNVLQIMRNDKDESTKDSQEKSKLYLQTKQMATDLEALADEVFLEDTPLMYVANEIDEEEREVIISFPEYIANNRKK